MAAELQKEAGDLAEQTRELAKQLERMRKALLSLSEQGGWTERSPRERSLRVLEELAGLSLPAYEGYLQRVRDELRSFLPRFRQAFLDRMAERLREEELPFAPLGDQPPTFEIGGLTLVLDFDREHADLCYARETLDRRVLKTQEILDARAEALAALEELWPGREEFFEALASSYRSLLAREGMSAGERVSIVDLIPELSVEFERMAVAASPRAATGPGIRRLTRAEFAYCLDRLAREGSLHVGDRRIELGTATGGSTKDKKRVLFLEAGMGGGQYYLSLRMTQNKEHA